MYIMNATIEAVDDQNEIIKIDYPSGSSCVEVDEKSGIVSLYTNISSESKMVKGSPKTTYIINRVPCTVYRNLKKITIKRGTQMPWKYIKFKSN